MGFGSVFKLDYSAAIDAIRDQRFDFIEMLTERRKQLQVTIVELSIMSPRTITSADFALAFDDYRKMRNEIAAVVNNFDVPGRLVLLELHKTALLRAKT